MGEDTKALRQAVAAIAGEDALPPAPGGKGVKVTDGGCHYSFPKADRLEVDQNGVLVVLNENRKAVAIFASGHWERAESMREEDA